MCTAVLELQGTLTWGAGEVNDVIKDVLLPRLVPLSFPCHSKPHRCPSLPQGEWDLSGYRILRVALIHSFLLIWCKGAKGLKLPPFLSLLRMMYSDLSEVPTTARELYEGKNVTSCIAGNAKHIEVKGKQVPNTSCSPCLGRGIAIEATIWNTLESAYTHMSLIPLDSSSAFYLKGFISWAVE